MTNSREIMIARNGKPLFAVRIDSDKSIETKTGEANYVYIENGDIRFSSSWLSNIVPFELSNDSHRLAKEIFTVGLQAAIKTKVMELKQLESILTDVNLQDCLGDVLKGISVKVPVLDDRSYPTRVTRPSSTEKIPSSRQIYGDAEEAF